MIKRNFVYTELYAPRNFLYGALLLLLVACPQIVITSELPGKTEPVVETALQSAQNGAEVVVQPENDKEFIGEMYKIGLGWHPAALQGLSRDKYGLVDWVTSLKANKIKPRGNVDPEIEEVPPFDMDIVMPSKTGMIEGAYFPHDIHTTWLACENCHTKIFMPIAGSNDLTMSRIVKGKACGVCHGKVAFPLNDCERCHVPQMKANESVAAEK